MEDNSAILGLLKKWVKVWLMISGETVLEKRSKRGENGRWDM